jgi:hypothetical protein
VCTREADFPKMVAKAFALFHQLFRDKLLQVSEAGGGEGRSPDAFVGGAEGKRRISGWCP